MSEQQSYWTGRRLSRRGALGAGAAGSMWLLAAAGLACSSSNNGNKGARATGTTASSATAAAATSAVATRAASTPASGTTPAAAAAAQPQPGGTFKSMLPWDPGNLDPIKGSASATSTTFGMYVYDRLLHFKPGAGQPSGGDVEPGLAASYELPGDGTQLTLKLQPHAKWDPRAPTNGRQIDSQDVKASWDNFAANGSFRGDLVHSVSPDAPIDSVETPDASTVVIKTAFPSALLLTALASDRHLFIEPREGQGQIDLAKEPRGSGPFMLDEYTPSVRIVLKKNPNYWGLPKQPLVDAIDMPIITDTAQAEAQFRAKNVWNGAASLPNLAQLHKDLKGTRAVLATPDGRNEGIAFGWKSGSPFVDDRVRQAISMLLDRDGWTEAFFEPKKLQSAGIDVGKARWGTIISGLYQGFWLDPRSKDFGEDAKYYQLNVAEAKKLLAAAGFPNGFETVGTYITSSQFGTDWARKCEAIIQQLAEGGIKVKPNTVEYNAYLSDYVRGKGNFEGLNFIPNGGRFDPGVQLANFVGSKGANGATVGHPIPELDALIDKANKTIDRNQRLAVFADLQRLGARTQPMVSMGGLIVTPDLTWDWVGGLGDYVGWAGTNYGQSPNASIAPYFWIDQSKRS